MPCEANSSNRALYNAVSNYAAGTPARFHMPGHKGFLNALDVTELSCTDNLHLPSGAIAELERNLSTTFCARESLLLVNGSTAGNLGMLLSLGQNKRVLLGRNCHSSALSGIALAGHDAISLYPDEYGVISPVLVQTAFESSSSPIHAVFITSPTYTGHCCDISQIARIAHSYGALLFVDCAHGAHFPFSDMLPEPPVEADAWVVSCHKTLNALTQSAVLNIGHACPMSVTDMRRYVSLIQSTSPSYLLMLSLENAIHSVSEWTKHCERINELRTRLEAIPGITLLDGGTAHSFDFTRLTLSVIGMSGYEIANRLEQNQIFPEMADLRSVILITSPNDPDEWYNRLERTLARLECKASADDGTPIRVCSIPCGERACSVRSAMLGRIAYVPLTASAGRIAAQAVGIYPPGIATLFPGEKITQAAVDMLIAQAEHGAALFGSMEGTVAVTDKG